MARRSIEQELETLRADGLFRATREASCGGARIDIQGRSVVNFSSNDYLNLANDERLKTAALRAVQQYGTGSTASPLMSGRIALHADLERDLAQWIGTETAIIFGSGFLANVGAVSSLMGRKDLIVADRMIHASLIDGARLTRATLLRFDHNDPVSLQRLLAQNSEDYGRVLVVTESIFSMDGDVAPLRKIARAARYYNALFMVDEAHALGAYGPNGRGFSSGLPKELRPDLFVGTFGKAFGGYGAFVACSDAMRDYLVNRARSYIYSTAPAPASLGAAREAIRIVDHPASGTSKTSELGSQLKHRITTLEEMLIESGFKTPRQGTPILPIVIGENKATLEAAESLLKDGVLAVAVRPPTVPEGTARLRLSVTLGHEDQDFQQLINALKKWRDGARQ
jgi:8-amino-7-oxononanoate synthase